MRSKVWSAGGRWLKERELWELPRSAVRALGIDHRIVEEKPEASAKLT
jgi:hypothetical protein